MYATCPNCYRKVNVEKNTIPESEAIKLAEKREPSKIDLIDILTLGDYECIKRVLKKYGVEIKEGKSGFDTGPIDDSIAEKVWEEVKKECVK